MKKILVVDDDDLIHELVNSALANDEYEIHHASSVAEALDLFEQESFDILLSDVVMPPGEDGTKLMQFVKTKHPGMPVLAMTGGIENAVNDYVNYADIFADHTLAKPFRKEELLEKLKKV